MNPNASPPPLDLLRNESVRDGFQRLARGLADAARLQAGRPATERDAAIHVTRLILKRSRAIVRLLRPTLGTAPAELIQNRLRAAAQRLAPARDQAAGRATLELLARDATGAKRGQVEMVRSRFASSPAARGTTPATLARSLKAAAATVERLARSLRHLPWQNRGWTVIDAGLHASYRRARRRFRAAHTESSETAFHDWRTTVKTLQYHVALLKPSAPKRLGGLVRQLDALGTCLGNEHDLAVLAAQLRRKPEALGGPGAVKAVLDLVASRQQALRKQALKQGRRIFGKRPSDFVASLHRAWKSWRRN
jgi:CHAD domain-containing protein